MHCTASVCGFCDVLCCLSLSLSVYVYDYVMSRAYTYSYCICMIRLVRSGCVVGIIKIVVVVELWLLVCICAYYELYTWRKTLFILTFTSRPLSV